MGQTRTQVAKRPVIDRPRVLIVDNEPETLVLLHALLEEEDIEVVAAVSGGVEAVSVVERLDPDVVLMDIRMPDMDGVRATRQIKTARPRTEVIFLTFYGESDALYKAAELGAFCYLVKGCPPSLIAQMIRRAWQHGRAAHSRH